MTVLWALPEALAPEVTSYLQRTLDADERTRAGRFAFAADRAAFVAAHGMLRVALSQMWPCPAGDWRFAADAAGKPRIVGGAAAAELTFSLSHTRSLVACAVARGGAVGIDVEGIAAHAPDDRLLEACCAPAEIRRLRALRADAQALEFARLWTLKEASVKAHGTGGLPLRSVEFVLNGSHVEQASVGGTEADLWTFLSLLPTGQHVLSLAYRGLGIPAPRICQFLRPD
jgi:4'-phosphopantetheinyl transferase